MGISLQKWGKGENITARDASIQSETIGSQLVRTAGGWLKFKLPWIRKRITPLWRYVEAVGDEVTFWLARIECLRLCAPSVETVIIGSVRLSRVNVNQAGPAENVILKRWTRMVLVTQQRSRSRRFSRIRARTLTTAAAAPC